MSPGLLILSDLIVTPAEAVLLVPALPGSIDTRDDADVPAGALRAVDEATVGRALTVALLALEATRAVQLALVARRRWFGLRRGREVEVRLAPAARTARWPAGSPEATLLSALVHAPRAPMTAAPRAGVLVERVLPRAARPAEAWTAARLATLAERALLASGGRADGAVAAAGVRWHPARGTPERAMQAQATASLLLDRCRTTRPLLTALVQAEVAAALRRTPRVVVG